MGRLAGKVAIITGSGRGIGRAIARRFALEGATIGVLSITPANVERTVGEITEAGGTALGVVCDVSDPKQIKASVERVAQQFGTIDILVNNAFEFTSVMSSVLDLEVAKLQRQFDTGPIACLHFMQACYPYLERHGGRVINFASSVGLQGTAGIAPYAMAKEAIRALTRVAAREWGARGSPSTTSCRSRRPMPMPARWTTRSSRRCRLYRSRATDRRTTTSPRSRCSSPARMPAT